MTDYRVQITDRAGTEKVADLFVTDLQISEALNGPGAASFTVPLLHDDATADNLAPGAREVRVYRGTTRIFGGLLWAVNADVNGRTIRCVAEGFFSALRHRLITSDIVAMGDDQLDIAWNLIAYTQSAGSLGITRGSATGSGVTRDLIWCVEDEAVVGDEIASMADADDGFDFWVDANKVWRTAYPRRGTTAAVALNAATNVSRLRIDADASYMANQIVGYDEPINCVPQTTTVQDASSISTYGLLQRAVTISDLKSSTLKSARLAEALRLGKTPGVQATATTRLIPWAEGYGVGDTVTLTAAAGFATFNATPFRVLSHTTTVKGLREEATVVLDSVIA